MKRKKQKILPLGQNMMFYNFIVTQKHVQLKIICLSVNIDKYALNSDKNVYYPKV